MAALDEVLEQAVAENPHFKVLGCVWSRSGRKEKIVNG